MQKSVKVGFVQFTERTIRDVREAPKWDGVSAPWLLGTAEDDMVSIRPVSLFSTSSWTRWLSISTVGDRGVSSRITRTERRKKKPSCFLNKLHTQERAHRPLSLWPGSGNTTAWGWSFPERMLLCYNVDYTKKLTQTSIIDVLSYNVDYTKN